MGIETITNDLSSPLELAMDDTFQSDLPEDESIIVETKPATPQTAKQLGKKAIPPVVEWGPARGIARREEREAYGPAL